MLKTALIVDDSKLARLTLKRMLSQYDIDVSEAEGVLDGESVIANTVLPDVVFMDVMMPGLDGFEGLARLRKNPETSDLPVIMYSGDISEEARQRARDSGATGYLPKPADVKRLDHLVDALNKRLRTLKEKAASAAPEPEVVAPKPAITPQELAAQNSMSAFAAAAEPPSMTTPFTTQNQPVEPSTNAVFDNLSQRLDALEGKIGALASNTNNVSVPEDFKHRLSAVEAHVSLNAGVPEDLQKRLSSLEKRVSSHEKSVCGADLSADIERQHSDIIYLQRQVAKAEQSSKVAIAISAVGLLVALVGLVRQLI